MSPAMLTAAAGLSEAAIARATNQTVERVMELLGEEWQRGLVEPTGRGWRLTDEAERRFGAALRALGSEPIRVGPAHASRAHCAREVSSRRRRRWARGGDSEGADRHVRQPAAGPT